MHRDAAIVIVLVLAFLPIAAQTVTVEASRDATLIEHPDGALANGSGPSVFSGRTGQQQGGVRRALLLFDVASALPERAIVEDAALVLFLGPSNPEPRELRLHRVLADWSEGPSVSLGGGGAPAEPGDVTWLHTLYDVSFWIQSGGQFVGRPSARLEVAGTGFYSWSGSPGLVRDVRLWKAAPRRNFGWILIGDEATPQSVKRFASRDEPDPTLRPVLEITYRLPGEPPPRRR